MVKSIMIKSRRNLFIIIMVALFATGATLLLGYQATETDNGYWVRLNPADFYLDTSEDKSPKGKYLSTKGNVYNLLRQGDLIRLRKEQTEEYSYLCVVDLIDSETARITSRDGIELGSGEIVEVAYKYGTSCN